MNGMHEPSYRVFAHNWRHGWFMDGCPAHSCEENRVQLDHMLYAVCGVCGEVDEDQLTTRRRRIAPDAA